LVREGALDPALSFSAFPQLSPSLFSF